MKLITDRQNILQLLSVGVIYSLIGIIMGILLTFFLAAPIVHKNRRSLSLYYFSCLTGLLFFLITAVNMLYLWFPYMDSKAPFLRSGVVLCLFLTAVLLGYFHSYTMKRRGALLSHRSGTKQRLLLQQKGIPFGLFLVFILTLSVISLYRGSHHGKSNRRGKPGPKMPPSIIFIVVDTLRADQLFQETPPEKNTSEINYLFKHSVVFSNAYTQAPWTRPAVATLMTSRYPSSHGVIRGSRIKGGPDILNDKAITLSEVLHHSGYYTAGFVANPQLASDFGFAQGYDEYHYYGSMLRNRFSLFEWIRKKLGIYLKNSVYVNAQTLTHKVSKWIEDKPPSPFFLYVQYMDPHRPYFHQPSRLWMTTDSTYDQKMLKKKRWAYRACYNQEVKFVKKSIDRFMDRLQELDLYENSLIVVTADHGEEFYEHGGWDHGRTLYEELLRVPLIIKLPHQKTGRMDRRLIRLLDVYPTILEILGFEKPSALQGRPMLGATGQPIGTLKYVFSERLPYGQGTRALRDQNWKFIESDRDNAIGTQTFELYDLTNDPHEKRDLSLTRMKLVKKLHSKTEEIVRDARKSFIPSGRKPVSRGVKDQLKALGYLQ